MILWYLECLIFYKTPHERIRAVAGGIDMKGLNIIPLNEVNNIINGLSPAMQSQIQSWTDILHEVFNRKVTYQGIVW